MKNALLGNPVILENSEDTLSVLVGSSKYTVRGRWKITTISQTDRLADQQFRQLSFDYVISCDDHNYLIHPDDLTTFTNLASSLTTGLDMDFSLRIISSSGEIKKIEGNGAIIYPDAEEARPQSKSRPAPASIDFESWAFDVHRNKQLLQSIFEASPAGITFAKAIRNEAKIITDFEVQLVNKTAETQTGTRDLRGKRYSAFDAFLSAQAPLHELADVVGNNTAIHRQILIDRNGRSCCLELAIVKFDDGLLIVSEDVTERVEAEAQVRQQTSLVTKVIESSPDIIQIINLRSGRSAYINKMLLEELRYPFEEIKRFENDNSAKTLVHPEDLILHDNFLNDIRQAGNDDTVEAELRWRRYDGRYVWFHMRAKIFERDASGVPENILVFYQNITDRKLAEEEKRNHQVLKEMEKARTAFFSNVSHEFRTPLTLLLAPLEEILRKGTINKNEIEKLHLAHRNALRLQKLVNTLLDFSRIESGKMEAVFQPVDLASLTSDLASNFRSVIEHGGLKFKVRCEPIEELIYVNREMYEKIVFNLLSNAFKFTFKGKIEVVLKENKNNVKLIVRDTGIGIANAHLQNIFDRFVRIEGAKARTYEGSGIGLALVRELVNVHRGNIKVSSTPEAGSEFIVTFPKGKSHLPARSIHETKETVRAPGLASAYVEEMKGWTVGFRGIEDNRHRNRRHNSGLKPFVLVVDDNADMRSYLKTLLSDDYEVTTVPTGKAAIECIEPDKLPDIILSDVMMPEVNGFELLKAIKSNDATKDIPVILVSAKAGEESKTEGLEYGADDYLVKPFSAKEMLARVDARIQIAKAQKSRQQALLDINHRLEQKVDERTAELQNVNASLNRKNAELQSLNEDLTTFTFVASHDLTEPLRKVQLYTHMLLDRSEPPLPDRTMQVLKRIIASTERMKLLVNEIHTYAKSQAERHRIEPANLKTLLQQAINDLEHIIAEKKAVIEYDELPFIRCNPVQISQLFQNLLSNSIKFAKTEITPKIQITSSVVEGASIDHPIVSAEHRYLRIEVKDNGIGFEPEYGKKIFEVFQRLHGRTEFAGTGMGLAVCKKIMENHNGFMLTNSEPGEGSVFCCYFPEKVIVV
jgi:PAS domain S-box-containing protein